MRWIMGMGERNNIFAPRQVWTYETEEECKKAMNATLREFS